MPGVTSPSRAAGGVSVVVPCFNHGLFLRECLDSVFAQSMAAAEIIVADDGSTDTYTLEILAHLEKDSRVTVLRGPNRGPGAARNKAIRHSTGAAVLPLDADNWIAPDAIEVLLRELQAAPPEVGWIYLHQQFFGSRSDLAVQPIFNAYLLTQRNYCDTSALIDRRMFDAGVMYREEIVLGHEDWDFYLQAIQKGFTGQLCQRRLLHVRKHGFTRSDAVGHRFGSFRPQVASLNPDLFGAARVLGIKRDWAPALSIVLADSAVGAGLDRSEVERLLAAQTCQDCELVDETQDNNRSVGPFTYGSLATSLKRAKGKYLLVWAASGAGPLHDPAFIEKGLRLLENANAIHGVVLVAQDPAGVAADWVPAAAGLGQSALPPVLGMLIRTVNLAEASRWYRVDDDVDATGALVAALDASAPDSLEWRSFRVDGDIAHGPGSIPTVLRLGPSTETTAVASEDDRLVVQSTEVELAWRMSLAPLWPVAHSAYLGPAAALIPGEAAATARFAWRPEYTGLVWLATEPVNGECHLVAEGTQPALTGLVFDSIVGRLYTREFPGTAPVFRVTDPVRQQSSLCFSASCQHDPRFDVSLLGFFSTAPLPGMINLLTTVYQRLQTTLAGAGILRTHCEGWSAFVEPEILAPPGIDELLETVIGEEAWPIYPQGGIEPAGGRYTLHPDSSLEPRGWLDDGRGRLGSVFAGPRRYMRPLHLLSHPHMGRHFYASTPDAGSDLGYVNSGTLGHLLTRPLAGTTPLYRFHSVSRQRHRLSLEPSTSDPDWVLDGPLGHVLAPTRDRPLLRRWRHRKNPTWRYTCDLGTPLPPGDEWLFDTTLGLVWDSSLRAPGLVPFVELLHPVSSKFAYSVHPEEFEELGHRRREIVCGLKAVAGPGMVPLRRSYSAAKEAHVYGLASHEQAADGFAPEGACGFLQPAVPPRRVLTGDTDLAAAEPPQLAGSLNGSGSPALYAEPRPGASPVYRFTRDDAEPWFGTDHTAATSAGYQIDDVVGYLVDTSAGLQDEPGANTSRGGLVEDHWRRWPGSRPIGRALGSGFAEGLRRAVAPGRIRWARRVAPVPIAPAPSKPGASVASDHESVQARDVFIAQTVAGRSFVDVGGLWGTLNEKVSVALGAGASMATMLDATPKGSELWKRFHDRCRELAIVEYDSVSADLNDLGLVERVGTFEVVHCSGVLYHSPNPLLSLAQLLALTEDVLILDSAVVPTELRDRDEWACGSGMFFVPHLSPAQLGPLRAILEDRAVGALGVTEPVTDWDEHDYAPWWWLFMPGTLEVMLRAVGFRVEADSPSWSGLGHTYLARRT